MNISEILIHLGEEDKESWARAVSPPIYQTSNFRIQTVAEYAAAMDNEKDISIYTRGNNPTVRLLEKKLAALQGTDDALVFASGSAAIAAAVVSCVKQGDHVLCVENIYSWTDKLLNQTLTRFGVTCSMVNGGMLEDFQSAYQDNTTLVILESPSSMMFEIQDAAKIIPWAKSKGLMVVYDNSFGTIMNRKPVDLGADLVCHSATKFVGGHRDVVSGVVCGSNELIRKVFNAEYMTFGASISPHAAWLLIRSLRTLQMRVAHSAKSARDVVSFLNSHDKVDVVHWPFLSTHPHHDLINSQFTLETPMFSFQLKTQEDVDIRSFCESLKYFQIGASWGGHESLIVPLLAFTASSFPKNLVRMYVGFEDPQILIEDLKQALS